MVLAPEHPLVTKLATPGQKEEVESYVFQAARQSDIQRESGEKRKPVSLLEVLQSTRSMDAESQFGSQTMY